MEEIILLVVPIIRFIHNTSEKEKQNIALISHMSYIYLLYVTQEPECWHVTYNLSGETSPLHLYRLLSQMKIFKILEFVKCLLCYCGQKRNFVPNLMYMSMGHCWCDNWQGKVNGTGRKLLSTTNPTRTSLQMKAGPNFVVRDRRLTAPDTASKPKWINGR